MQLSDIPSRGRATQGVIVMRLNAKDKVATMSVIMHDPESEQAVLEAAEETREEEVLALEEEQAKVERTAKRQRKAAAK
jgi:DNA gyrase/topoisomerase IV subunit A